MGVHVYTCTLQIALTFISNDRIFISIASDESTAIKIRGIQAILNAMSANSLHIGIQEKACVALANLAVGDGTFTCVANF
jgi:hypothetical protein